MADLGFKEAEAQSWKVQVEGELNRSSQVLVRVHSDCMVDPAEDDDILKAIMDAGTRLENAWNEMARTFDDTKKALDKVIKDYADAVSKGVEAVKNFMKNFKL